MLARRQYGSPRYVFDQNIQHTVCRVRERRLRSIGSLRCRHEVEGVFLEANLHPHLVDACIGAEPRGKKELDLVLRIRPTTLQPYRISHDVADLRKKAVDLSGDRLPEVR